MYMYRYAFDTVYEAFINYLIQCTSKSSLLTNANIFLATFLLQPLIICRSQQGEDTYKMFLLWNVRFHYLKKIAASNVEDIHNKCMNVGT